MSRAGPAAVTRTGSRVPGRVAATMPWAPLGVALLLAPVQIPSSEP